MATQPLPTQAATSDTSPGAPKATVTPAPKHKVSFLKHLGELGLEAFSKAAPFIGRVAQDCEPAFDLLFPLEGPVYNFVVRAICLAEAAGSNKKASGETKLQWVTSLVGPDLKTIAAKVNLPDEEVEPAISNYISGLVAILSGPGHGPEASGALHDVAALAESLPAARLATSAAVSSADCAAVQPSTAALALQSSANTADASTASDCATSAASTAPPLYPCTIIDLSHFNGAVDLSKAAADGVAGVIHKATQGKLFCDPRYADNRKNALAAGLLWGAYHFGTCEDGKDQAKHFLSTVAPDQSTILALDFETNTMGPSMTIDQARDFVSHVQQQTGRWPGLYGGYYLRQALAGKPDPVLANCWLWLSQYDDHPLVPPNWKAWTLWQYTNGSFGIASKPISGVGICDQSFYSGTQADLTARWKQGVLA